MVLVDAVMQIVDVVHQAEAINRRAGQMMLFVTFDVRNTFNSVRQKDVLGTLGNRFDVQNYLLQILRNYMEHAQNRLDGSADE